MEKRNNAIAPRLLHWAAVHGRHDLPWQTRSGSRNRIAYRVWVAEIMLQQTRVTTVIPYFRAFARRFPSVQALAQASLDEVLAHWSGLGYYARARNLHQAAQRICDEFGSRLPATRSELESLPGIGRSTAAAILAQTDGKPEAILDGNAKRVLARYHAVPGWPGETAVNRRLWRLAEQATPTRDVAAYTQAIMDLGATVCTRGKPDCPHCPLAGDCRALLTGRVDEYPGARPKRQLPQRQAFCVLMFDEHGQILLLRRPPVGVWGGLWSLPQWSDEADCLIWLEAQGIAPHAVERLATIEHTFTHFRLQLSPLWAGSGKPGRVGDDDTRWYRLADALALGLPAPIRTLLESLQTHSRQENSDGAHGAMCKAG